jgi:hypothetical protein
VHGHPDRIHLPNFTEQYQAHHRLLDREQQGGESIGGSVQPTTTVCPFTVFPFWVIGSVCFSPQGCCELSRRIRRLWDLMSEEMKS